VLYRDSADSLLEIKSIGRQEGLEFGMRFRISHNQYIWDLCRVEYLEIHKMVMLQRCVANLCILQQSIRSEYGLKLKIQQQKPPTGDLVEAPRGCRHSEVAGAQNRFVAVSLGSTLFLKPSAERNQQKDNMNKRTIPSPLIAGRSLTIKFHVDFAINLNMAQAKQHEYWRLA